jgi:integrase/recombinase XerD
MGEMTFQQALEEYKTVYMPARNLAARTRIEYAHDLEGFIGFLEKSYINRVGELQTAHIDRYLADLDSQGQSGATRKRKAITIRSFLDFLFRNDHLSNDLASRVILPFQEQTTPRILTQTEYTRLLEACSLNPRDFAIISLLLQTGMRLSELTNLRTFDFELLQAIDSELGSTGTIRIIKGGGRKSRNLPLNSKANRAVLAYLNIRPSVQTDFVFLNRLNKPLGPRGVEKVLLKYMRLAGIKGALVHSLRHTFTAHHVAKGTSLETIQEVMGHKDIRTTEAYIPIARQLKQKEIQENAL